MNCLFYLLKVEAEIIKQQESKKGLTSKSEVQDKGLNIIRLRYSLTYTIPILVVFRLCPSN